MHCLRVNVSKLSSPSNFLQQRCLSVSSFNYGKNPYLTPTRDIILQNKKLEELVKVKAETSDVNVDPKSQEIIFKNRNPRHLELLGFNKPVGFTALQEKRNFYNNLTLEITNRHTKAFVENIKGDIICYASTTEHYIAKRLHSTTDVCAVVNIARILAERCKQVGIERVHWFTRMDRTTEKVREFEGILKNRGMILSELPTKVLQGTSETLPPARKARVMPGPMKSGAKRRGTIGRVDRKSDFLSRVTLD